MPDGTSRFKARGKSIAHFVCPVTRRLYCNISNLPKMGTSTFSQYTVVAEVSVVRVAPAAPLDKVCLLGCGITTAWGAVTKQAGISTSMPFSPTSTHQIPTEDSTVAVFGCGCIGLGVINTARDVGASRIIAVDTNPAKESWCQKFGATDFVNPAKLPEGTRIQDHLVKMMDGGLDFTFDCTGNVEVMRAALESCHKGWGVCTIIGVAAAGQEIKTRPFQLVTGRTWRGSAFGGVVGLRSTLTLTINSYVLHRKGAQSYLVSWKSIWRESSKLMNMLLTSVLWRRLTMDSTICMEGNVFAAWWIWHNEGKLSVQKKHGRIVKKQNSRTYE